jgi:hypothetical protein
MGHDDQNSLAEYHAAKRAFEAISDVISHSLTAGIPPTESELRAEETARVRLFEARRALASSGTASAA